jgi:hypothetical protein
MKNSQRVFLFFALLVFLIFFLVLEFHLNIVFLPFTFLFIGIGIRIFFRSDYIIVFTFLFPLTPAFAFFENQGFPFNYLVLPIILLTGVVIGELFLNRQKIFQLLAYVNKYYLLLLLFISISVVFVILRWSNLTLSSIAAFANTLVAPPDIRFSFGTIFPLIYLLVFFMSPFYFLYLREIENKKRVVIAFLLGHSVSILFSLIQNLFKVKLFLWKPCNGLASDNSSFGFLSATALLLSVYIFFKYEEKRKGTFFCLISLLGILISHSRLGLIAVFFTIFYFLFKLKKRELLIFITIVLVVTIISVCFVQNPEISRDIYFLKEMKKNIVNFQRFIISGEKHPEVARKFLAGREQVWVYALKIMKAYPLCGVGVGNFLFWVMYDQYGQDYFHDLVGNQYLFFSSGIGILGLLVFLVFLYGIWAEKKGLDKWIFSCVLIIFLFGSHFWISEAFLLFWLLCSLNHRKKSRVFIRKKPFYLISGLIVGVFILSNVIQFGALHPKNWANEVKTDYDYGFWYQEKDSRGKFFSWTGKKAGIYLNLNEQGKSKKIKLFCGAPLQELKEKQQSVNIYWRGQSYKKLVFKENQEFEFRIDDQSHDEGFLEFRIEPAFNLRRMGLSEEARDLGIQFYYPE